MCVHIIVKNKIEHNNNIYKKVFLIYIYMYLIIIIIIVIVTFSLFFIHIYI